MNRSDSIASLAKALVAAQKELKNPALDKSNPHFRSKFASLAGVRDTVTPILAKHGLTVLQLLCNDEHGVACETVLTHESGEFISSTFSVPVTKHDAQGVGSAATYARRYALMALCNVVGDEDDDGNAAAKAAPARPESAKSVAQVAWEALTPKRQNELADIAADVADLLAQDRAIQANETIQALGLDADDRAALWFCFDSKQRAALKAAAKAPVTA